MSSTTEFFYIDDRPTDYCKTVFIWAVVDFSRYPYINDVNKCSDLYNESFVNSNINRQK